MHAVEGGRIEAEQLDGPHVRRRSPHGDTPTQHIRRCRAGGESRPATGRRHCLRANSDAPSCTRKSYGTANAAWSRDPIRRVDAYPKVSTENITVTAINEAVAIERTGCAVASASVSFVSGHRRGLAVEVARNTTGTTRMTTDARTIAARTGTATSTGSTTQLSEPGRHEPHATITSNTTNAAMPATSLPSRRRRRPAGCTSLTPRTAKINMNATNPTVRSRDTTDPSTDRASTLQPPRPARWPSQAPNITPTAQPTITPPATGSAASMARNHPITQRFAPRRRSNDTVRWWSALPPRPASTATPKNSTSSAPIGTANRFSVMRVRLLIDKSSSSGPAT